MSHTLDPSSKLPTASETIVSPETPSTSTSPTATNTAGTRRSIGSTLSWLPSVLVVSALMALAWYGHHNDWTLPSIESLSGKASETVGIEWCDSHGVPEAECINCQSDLIEDADRLTFCTEHGVHGCVLCNPELAETKDPVVPTADDLIRATNALQLRPRKENLPISSFPGSRIQFASIEAMNKAGVDVEPIQRGSVVESISASGEIRYDETKMALISPQAHGVVRRISVEVGDWVDAGDLLALVDSSEAGRLKTQLAAAVLKERMQKVSYERIKPLAGGAVSGQRVLESKSDLQQATAEVKRLVVALANLGIRLDASRLRTIDEEELEQEIGQAGLSTVKIESLPKDWNARNLIAVTAPLAGQIGTRETTLGEVVDRGSQMFRIVDTRTVWLDLRVPSEQASLIQLGQTSRFLPDGITVWREGQVTWISTETDSQTRTVRVRAELANEDRGLRHELFGRGQVVLRNEPDAIVVPETAVQWDGTGNLVFVRDARFFEKDRPKFFVARSVRLGVKRDGMIEIIAGVLPGEVVASRGGDVLRAQLLRSNLGAGCTCGK